MDTTSRQEAAAGILPLIKPFRSMIKLLSMRGIIAVTTTNELGSFRQKCSFPVSAC
jgi:hypothetical protein